MRDKQIKVNAIILKWTLSQCADTDRPSHDVTLFVLKPYMIKVFRNNMLYICVCLDSCYKAFDEVCVLSGVCLLVPNPPLQNDSPLSSWLVWLAAGAFFHLT